MHSLAVAAACLAVAAPLVVAQTPAAIPATQPSAQPAQSKAPSDSARASIAARLAVLWPATAGPPAFPPSTIWIQRGKEVADTLPSTIAVNIVWTRDSRGFFYTSAPRPWQLFYHWLKRPGADYLVYESPDHAGATAYGTLSSGGQYLVITATHPGDTRTRLLLVDLDDPGHPAITAPIIRLFDDLDASYRYVGNAGPGLFVWTDRDAPRGRIISIDATDPRQATERTALAESAVPLVTAQVAARRIFATYREDGADVLRVFSLTGLQLGTVSLPAPGSVGRVAWGGRSDHDTIYVAAQAVLAPPAVYVYIPRSGQTALWKAVSIPFDSAQFETRPLHYDSAGGTHSTVFVTARKGLALDGMHAAWVDTTSDSSGSRLRFSPLATVWLELGNVYAVPAQSGAAAAQGAGRVLAARKYARPDAILTAAPPPPSSGINACAEWLAAQVR